MLFNMLYFVSLPVGQVKPKKKLAQGDFSLPRASGQALFSNPALNELGLLIYDGVGQIYSNTLKKTTNFEQIQQYLGDYSKYIGGKDYRVQPC